MGGQHTVVRTLSDAEGERLRSALRDGGFAAHRNPSARWALRGEGVTAVFYASGKLVVQGAGAAAFAESRLGGGRPVPTERLDGDLIGTDESGKGDYFGPLVVAAVMIPRGQEEVLAELGVRDSKAMADGAAAGAARTLRAAYPHEVVVIGPARYNEMYEGFRNLNRLLAWATAEAIGVVAKATGCRRVLSDKFGDERLIAGALAKKGVDVDLAQRVRAESNPAVAAASVLARESFLTSLGVLARQTGTKLPKGAGPPVEAAARRIYREGGREALARVAKMHFKTTARVTGELF